MSQSEWLGAILIAGFLVWLAMNKRLATYWSILLGGSGAATTTTTNPATGKTTTTTTPAPAAPGATQSAPPATAGPGLFPINPGNIAPLNFWPFTLFNPPAGSAPAAAPPAASSTDNPAAPIGPQLFPFFGGP